MYISGSVGMARCHTLLQLANKYHFFPIFLLHFKKIVYLCTRKKRECGNSSVGRAQPCQGWGRGFKSRLPLQFKETGAAMVELVDTRDLKSLGQ